MAFAYDAAGHTALAAWADEHACGAPAGCCLGEYEAYCAALAAALDAAGRYISVVHPARIKYSGLMRGQGNKTNKAGTRLIAENTACEWPAARQPATAETQELQPLLRLIDDLLELAAHEKGRLAAMA